MQFIFMLTTKDQTVADCLRVYDEIRSVGLKHVGFKDVGAGKTTLEALTKAIHADGAASYMEIVSTSAETALASAQMGLELGVQNLLGGTSVDAVMLMLRGTPTAYLPFPGKPYDHPTKLGGKADDIQRDCASFMAKGCAGCDILAYRATEAEPLDLIHAARRGLGPDGRLIVAGSVGSAERIQAIAAAGADAFTIGSAIFDGSYSARNGSIRSQIEAVMRDCEAASNRRAA